MKILKKIRDNIFITSFLPAIAYWYLEAHYPLKVAVIGGILLSFLEVSWEWFWNRKLHNISKINFLLMVVLGALSLFEENGAWFKLSPAIGLLVMGIMLGINLLLNNKSFLWKTMQEMSQRQNKVLPLPPELLEQVFLKLEKHLFWFLITNSFLLAGIAWFAPTNYWVFYKTIGLYIGFFIFLLVELFIMRISLKRKIKEMQTYTF